MHWIFISLFYYFSIQFISMNSISLQYFIQKRDYFLINLLNIPSLLIYIPFYLCHHILWNRFLSSYLFIINDIIISIVKSYLHSYCIQSLVMFLFYHHFCTRIQLILNISFIYHIIFLFIVFISLYPL